MRCARISRRFGDLVVLSRWDDELGFRGNDNEVVNAAVEGEANVQPQ